MNSRRGLNKEQQSLVNELHEIYGLLGLDFYRIHQSSASNKIEILKSNLIRVVRGEIIWQYNMIDTAMNSKLLLYLFPEEEERRTEREAFEEYLLRWSRPRDKLKFLKEIIHVPDPITSRIEEVIELRNAVAHSLYPLITTERPRKTEYRGKDIYSVEGVRMFHNDWYTIVRYLLGL